MYYQSIEQYQEQNSVEYRKVESDQETYQLYLNKLESKPQKQIVRLNKIKTTEANQLKKVEKNALKSDQRPLTQISGSVALKPFKQKSKDKVLLNKELLQSLKVKTQNSSAQDSTKKSPRVNYYIESPILPTTYGSKEILEKIKNAEIKQEIFQPKVSLRKVRQMTVKIVDSSPDALKTESKFLKSKTQPSPQKLQKSPQAESKTKHNDSKKDVKQKSPPVKKIQKSPQVESKTKHNDINKDVQQKTQQSPQKLQQSPQAESKTKNNDCNKYQKQQSPLIQNLEQSLQSESQTKLISPVAPVSSVAHVSSVYPISPVSPKDNDSNKDLQQQNYSVPIDVVLPKPSDQQQKSDQKKDESPVQEKQTAFKMQGSEPIRVTPPQKVDSQTKMEPTQVPQLEPTPVCEQQLNTRTAVIHRTPIYEQDEIVEKTITKQVKFMESALINHSPLRSSFVFSHSQFKNISVDDSIRRSNESVESSNSRIIRILENGTKVSPKLIIHRQNSPGQTVQIVSIEQNLSQSIRQSPSQQHNFDENSSFQHTQQNMQFKGYCEGISNKNLDNHYLIALQSANFSPATSTNTLQKGKGPIMFGRSSTVTNKPTQQSNDKFDTNLATRKQNTMHIIQPDANQVVLGENQQFKLTSMRQDSLGEDRLHTIADKIQILNLQLDNFKNSLDEQRDDPLLASTGRTFDYKADHNQKTPELKPHGHQLASGFLKNRRGVNMVQTNENSLKSVAHHEKLSQK